MMRQLNLNEMEMVSGGEDTVIATGTQTSSNDFGLDYWSRQQFEQSFGGGGLSHGGLGVFGQLSGVSGTPVPDTTPPETEEADDNVLCSTSGAPAAAVSAGSGCSAGFAISQEIQA